jgi:thiamine pyrophosphokinase
VRWPLDRADLAATVGLGVSNVATNDAVDVSVISGVLTVFVDDHLDIRPPPTEAS